MADGAPNATRTARIGFGLLAVSALPLGVWAVVAPRSFYDDFPGFGRHWVSPDGPYNEHLLRDFGGLNLALVAFTVCAAVWVLRPMVVATALAWLAYAVPHLLYHVLNLHHYDTTDQVGVLAGLVIAPVIACALLVTSRSLPARS
jgi:hypothetical protein